MNFRVRIIAVIVTFSASLVTACGADAKPAPASKVPVSDALEPQESQDPVAELGYNPFDQSQVPLEVEPPADFKGKKIILIAGKKSHPPAQHEFFAGTAILMDLLKQTPGVWPVMVRDGWPKNEKIFEDAHSLVFYMDGRDGHPVVQKDRLKMLQPMIDKGIGWVNMHYAVDYKPEHGNTVVGWMGGYYDPRISTNPHWDAAIRSLPKHPITQGVQAFTLRDEWYYNMHWIGDVIDVKEAKGVTPILQAIPPDNTRGTADAKKYLGRLETMAWAYERADGGRAFGFTGGHFHRNWADENYRRLVVNAILWSAKVDVPDTGAKVVFDTANLNRNLDDKGKKFEKILPPQSK